MFKPKRDKRTAAGAPENHCRQQPLNQIEAELTGVQLEAIADALSKLTTLYTGFREELMAEKRSAKVTAASSSPASGVG